MKSLTQERTYHQRMILKLARDMGIDQEFDPRHIEAYIRTEHRTMNQLDLATIKKEIRTFIDEGPEDVEVWEYIAKAFGI